MSDSKLKEQKKANHFGIPSTAARETWAPPKWALLERLLFDTLNKAAVEFAERYVRPDGTLIWRKDWPGMDGSDDPYEGFMYLPLLYALGGSEKALELGRKIWDGITWQWTEYGQIYREFDAYYDWMHHGEGYLYLYFLGLADPYSLKDRQRARRFAAFYTGEDEEAVNYDKEYKLIRSPINGSKGPRFTMTEEDWVTHRGILDNYLAPFEDIPGVDFPSGKCPWSDDVTYKEIIRVLNERMARGDVPLNLNATGLIAHAYFYSQDGALSDWILEYYGAWRERAAQNGGIIPDNVGLTGKIGEYMDGKWWGGYYGWRWPHGFMTILEPLINAASNAYLISGDISHLDFARSQLDRNWELGRSENGRWFVPHKHFDNSWADFRPANPFYPIHLWTVSMADEDLKRVERVGDDHQFLKVHIPGLSGEGTKHYNGNTVPWFYYIRGRNPEYPEQILEANYRLILNQLSKMRSEDGDPKAWITDDFNLGTLSSIHKWQEMCPVYFEGLLQMTLGAPMHISHGGLQRATVRYFDGAARRPGLPEGVGALVEKLDAQFVDLQIVNLDPFSEKEIIIQAGMFGEHRFEQVILVNLKDEEEERTDVGGKWLHVHMPPGAGIKLRLTMSRYVYAPSYDTPWPANETLSITGRTLS